MDDRLRLQWDDLAIDLISSAQAVVCDPLDYIEGVEYIRTRLDQEIAFQKEVIARSQPKELPPDTLLEEI